MKLIVSIDKENYKRIKDDVYDTHDIHRAIISIRKGTPFDDMLDKIRAEIEQTPTIEWIDNSMSYILANYFKKQILEIIDKYREGENEKNKKRFENELIMMQTNIFPCKGEQE